MDPKDCTSKLVFFVNGKKVEDDSVDPEWTLSYYLRTKLRLCGTKVGCAEGGCGACTVMVSKYDRKKKDIVHLAVNACLAPVCAMHGLAVTTVEGIGSVRTKLHPVQERIAKAHGSQCGFCTPGFVMSMYTLLRAKSGKPKLSDIEKALQGNLCRCTGYRPILEGYKTFTEEWEETHRMISPKDIKTICGKGSSCCKNKGGNSLGSTCNGIGNFTIGSDTCNDSKKEETLFDCKDFIPWDPTQEPIFPPELLVSNEYDCQFLQIRGPRAIWFRPLLLEELLYLKECYPSAKIINGNTEVGVEVKFKNTFYPTLIMPSQIKEMNSVLKDSEGLRVGASTTITELEMALQSVINTEAKKKTRIFEALLEMLQYFSGKQIRNTATIGGNIMTSTPLSDLNQIFMAANSTLELMSRSFGRRMVNMDGNFWTGYRKNIIKDVEVILAIHIPFSNLSQYFKAYKQARLRTDGTAFVNAAFNLTLNGNIIKNIRLAYGCMGPTTILAERTSQKLCERKWDEAMLLDAYKCLSEELDLQPSSERRNVTYKMTLSLSFFYKFYLYICHILEEQGHGIVHLPALYQSGIKLFQSLSPQSSQVFALAENNQKLDNIGMPIVHNSAYKQATGEAIYCDDVPKLENECFLSLVTSSRAHAEIINIDFSEALSLPGVLLFLSATDIGEENKYGLFEQDEEIFARRKVKSHGQVIGAVVAETQIIARRASSLVKIEYKDLKPVIFTIEDAIKYKSYTKPTPIVIKKGEPEEAFRKAENILQGQLHIGGQEHFYLETHSCIAVPKGEDGEMEIIISSQIPTLIQTLVAKVLQIPCNRVTCKVKRIGGGFGGKETKSCILALPVALAASRLNRPVRALLDRNEDMVITGHRHPFIGKYKVAFTKKGKITACEINLYNNAGFNLDLSESVMQTAMFHFTNAYFILNVACYGYSCKTNTPSNTAFRGFGAPQSMLIGETMVTHIAEALRKDTDEIRSLNLQKEGNITHYNQELTYCTLNRCWSECISNASYYVRKAEVNLFNRSNRFKKRGIALIPTMFGICFTDKFLNQGGALVLVYIDGSVLISHGGIEMGQGLHTKMIQVASRALGISVDFIHISETSTDKVPNTTPTAASLSSDLYGMAILDACNVINERLKSIKESNPQDNWFDWVKSAYFSRISLAATGFYKTPDIGYDINENKGRLFNYHTFGAACSEVEIDCLTGAHQILRTDIVMDVGESLNPAIDIGQIEGAFIQGYGLFTLEELLYYPTGELRSKGPSTYKIPTLADIPAQFNVSLLKGAPNPRAVYSSKAVGEPPLFLASSVFFAIRNAVRAAREDFGKHGYFRFDSPATCAKIRMACADQITEKFPEMVHNDVS